MGGGSVSCWGRGGDGGEFEEQFGFRSDKIKLWFHYHKPLLMFGRRSSAVLLCDSVTPQINFG